MSERPKVFVKSFKMKHTDPNFLQYEFGRYERLGVTGLFPEVHALKYDADPEGEGAWLMEEIEGYTLAELHLWFDDYKFSVLFAQKLGHLFTNFYNEGFAHQDSHTDNIMLDMVNQRLVFVDGDDVYEAKGKDERYPLRDVVGDFSVTLLDLYLGKNPYHILEDDYSLLVFGEDRSKWSLPSEHIPGLESFIKDLNEEETAYQTFLRHSRGPTLFLLNKAEVLKKINPEIKEFTLRGINPNTTPENFDELFAMSS